MIEFPNEESKWSWLAGITDSDSCLCVIRNHDILTRRGFSFRPTAKFEQTNKEFIEEVRNVASVKSKIIHIKSYKGQKPLWAVTLCSTELRNVLPKIIPFLIKKKPQAVLLLEAAMLLKEHYPNHTPHDKRLGEIYEALHSLNEKGKHKEVFEK